MHYFLTGCKWVYLVIRRQSLLGVGLRRLRWYLAYLFSENSPQRSVACKTLTLSRHAGMNSSTANSTSGPALCYSLECTFTKGERNFIVFSLFSIVAISLLGNIPIMIAILFSSKRRNSSNLSTLNLVVSDLLITIFCIPFVTLDLYVFSNNWIFGPTMCRLVTFVQNTAVLASLMNLLTITFEKFLAVGFPFNIRLRKKLVCRIMPVAWIIAILDSIFYVRFKKMKEFGDNLYCTEDWPDPETFRNATIAKLAIFFVPLILITIFHSITIYTLVKRKRSFHLQLHRSERDSFRKVLSKHKRQKKAVKIILLNLIAIIICWAPIYIFLFLVTFVFVGELSPASMNTGYTVCVWLLFSHCSVSPLIYFFMTQKGKETIAMCSLCLRTCRLQGKRSNMGALLLDSSNNHGGSVRTTGRYSSWRRSSTPRAETRL